VNRRIASLLIDALYSRRTGEWRKRGTVLLLQRIPRMGVTSELFFTVLGIALCATLLVGHLRLSWAIFRPSKLPEWRSHYPSITVIRPIRGLDPGCRENTLALLNQRYPGGRQTLFVFDSESDPAYAVVSEVVRESGVGREARVLIAGAPPPDRTGKLNAMLVGLEFAQGSLVAFSDSDSRPGPELLRLLVEELLNRPEAGDTFAPVVTQGDPVTAGDAGYALLVNAWYGATVAKAAEVRGELPFIMGELIVFTRDAIAKIGGLEIASGQLVDDMYLGACVAKAGLKNVMVPWTLPIVTGALSFREFLKLFRRWLVFSQSGLPKHFRRASWLRGMEYATACVATLVALVMGARWGALFPAAAAVLFVWSELALQTRFSGHSIPVRHYWVAAALPFIGGAFALSTRLDHTVEWRGRSYKLDRKARLARGPATPAAPR
jgi:ceramide glucosyltransferase